MVVVLHHTVGRDKFDFIPESEWAIIISINREKFDPAIANEYSRVFIELVARDCI